MRSALTSIATVLAALSVSACAQLKTSRKTEPAAAPAAPIASRAPVAAAPVVRPPPPVAAARGCVPRTLPQPPRYPDSDAALRDAPGAADRYQLMAAGRLMRQKRLDELERVVAGCR